MAQAVDVRLKICLLGDGAVGKTSLIRRSVENIFNSKYLPTIGTGAAKKKIIVKKPELEKDFHLNIMIWDIMGQLSFRKLLHPTYLKGAKGAILVCDLTNRKTLEHLDAWIDSLYMEWRMVPSVFVANKSDLEDKNEFDQKEMESYASIYDSPSFTTSAKTGENVESAFQALGEMIVEEQFIKPNSVNQETTDEDD